MSGDTFSYAKTNANYWNEQYPGIFDKLQGASKHANLSHPTAPRKRPKVTGTLAPPRREGETLVITLPLPDAKLQPNRATGLHWQEKGRLAKAVRSICGLLAKQIAPPEPFKKARLDITTWTTKKVDPANVWQWCKSAIDSLADAGIIVNDRDLECGEIVGHYGKAAGERRDMEFRVTPIGEQA